jgi:hypothetical protein
MRGAGSSNGGIAERAIGQLVTAWYEALDAHVPLDQVWTLLADTDLRMSFPDGQITGRDTFQRWYERVTNLFFDEVHRVESVVAKLGSAEAIVDVVVHWEASFWQPPTPRSKRVSLQAVQRWTVRPSRKNPYGLEITSYDATVEPFKYDPGSSTL